MKHIAEIYEDDLVLDGGYARGELRSNFKIYYKNSRHLINDYYKLGKRENSVATFRKGKHLEISGEASISINPSIDGELLVMSDFNSKLDEPWILDIACTLHM